MTTLAELVAQTPPPSAGVPAGFVHTAGVWRHVVEIADPGLGSAVVWHDVTTIDGLFTGYQYGRGSDGYQGRYRASVVQLDFYASSDALAPWNPDNSATFGVHVELGPGLLIRSGFILVDAGVVTAWNPRFTCKVDSWGDASYSSGRVRIHRVTARDTMSSLVNVPIPATTAENWSDRFLTLLADAGWPYGALMYGAQRTSLDDGVLELPDRPAASSAINELDAILDSAGLVWYTNRLGQLIVRPRPADTFHAAAFADGATGTPWTDRTPTYFAWWAAQGGAPGEYPGADHAAYAVDTPSVDSFGFDDTDRWVINHVKIADPFGPGFDDDDPVSIGRYDRKSFQASWLAPNPTVAADMLTMRAYATVEARPLHTNVRLDGFHPGPAAVEYLDPVSIVHRNNDEGLEVFGDGWLRSYTEQVRPLGCDTDWSMSFLVDIAVMSARTTDLLPVEDLILVDVTDTTASFTWTNPAQTVEPTHTQIRMINPASLWQTVEYPLTGLTWYGLTAETGYEFQVRLLRIVDGLTTHYSPLRSVTFVTEETADVPPVDAGCVLEWRLESSVDGVDPWLLVDSGVDEEAPFTLPDYDLGSLDPELWYRWVSHEDCAGVDGPDVTTDPFVADCMGAERLETPPYDDEALIAYWPEVCPNRIIREAVSDGVMIPGHALAGAAGVPGVASPVLQSGTAGLIGYQIVSSTPPGFSDLSISCRIMIGAQPAGATKVFEYGGAWISIVPEVAAPDPDAAGFTIDGTVNATGHFEQTVNGSTIFGRDTELEVLLTHNPSTGELILYVDNVLETAHTFPTGDRIRDQMRMTLPADSWITDAAAWDVIFVPIPPGTVFDWIANTAQVFIVPAGVTLLTVEAWGAQGGGNLYTDNGLGGRGGYVKCDLTVTPGEHLRILVGEQGTPRAGRLGTGSTASDGGLAGDQPSGGGGASQAPTGTGRQSGGGGGASEVRRTPYALANRLVIAGGGGGASDEPGRTNVGAGDGGTPAGGEGRKGSGTLGDGGNGGTATAGGTGGTTVNTGAAGTLGQGGFGSGAPSPGGGGGGGLYGGGGGSGSTVTATHTGAGGGGSGLSTGVNETLVSGVRSGHGRIIIHIPEP